MLSANVLSAAPFHAATAASVSQAPGTTSLSQGKSTASPHVAGKTVTSINLDTSDVDPSPGEKITFTAEVFATSSAPKWPNIPPYATSATGTVTFMAGATVLGTAAVRNGVASFTMSTLALKDYSVTAAYSGDSAFSASTSSPVAESIPQNATTVSLTSSPAAGQTVTLSAGIHFRDLVVMTGYDHLPSDSFGIPRFYAQFIAIIDRPGDPVSDATGTVTFMEGSTVLGTAKVTGGGATLSISASRLGAGSITAVYSGDLQYEGSTSGPVA